MENPKDRDRGRDRDRDRDPSFEEVPPPVMLTMGFWVFGVEKCKIKKKKHIETGKTSKPVATGNRRQWKKSVRLRGKKEKLLGKINKYITYAWRGVTILFQIYSRSRLIIIILINMDVPDYKRMPKLCERHEAPKQLSGTFWLDCKEVGHHVAFRYICTEVTKISNQCSISNRICPKLFVTNLKSL